MRYTIHFSAKAQLVDHDGTTIQHPGMLKQLDGLACQDDSVLNYAEFPFATQCDMRGGFPRLAFESKSKLEILVEIDSQRKMTRSELKVVREDIEGQMTDGIGAGCFDALSVTAGISVEVQFPLKVRCVQVEGTAWKPKSTTQRGNERRIAAVAKLVEKVDSQPPQSVKRASKVAPPESTKSAAHRRPNFKKLFRLLAKPERDQLFDEIKRELEACGNDLSSVGDRVYPPGNFREPKLLRLLLKAGLPPETLDEKGFSLLYHAAGSPSAIDVLLKAGVEVNRTCEDFSRTTALHRASSLGARKSVQVLLAAGADAKIKDARGRTALQCVDTRARERTTIESVLREASGG